MTASDFKLVSVSARQQASRNFMLERLSLSGLTSDDLDVEPLDATPPQFRIRNPITGGGITRIDRADNKYMNDPGLHDIYARSREEYEAWCAATDKAIVEGPLKTVACAQYLQLPAIGVTGCGGWSKNHKLLPKIADGVHAGDHVTIIFDGDMATNKNVGRRTRELAEHLTTKGCAVEIVQFPGSQKLDDWIMQQPSKAVAKLRKAFADLPRIDSESLPGNGAPAWDFPPPITQDEWRNARLAPDCIVESYLYADVAMLAAPGGTGKTTLLLYEAIHIALGLPLYGMPVRKPGPVVILTAEDSRETCVARLREIAAALVLTGDQAEAVRCGVHVSDLCGSGLRLTDIADDVVVTSPMVDRIIEECRPYAPVLISIDPAISFGVGESRVNDAEQGLVEAARRIRSALNCCVRFVHHTGKQNARDRTVDQYAGRGGSAFPDGSRMVAVLQPVDADEWKKLAGAALLDGECGLILARPKTTHAAPQPSILIRRRGHAFSWTLQMTQTNDEKLDAACAAVLDTIRAELALGHWPTQNSLFAQAQTMSLSQQVIRHTVAELVARAWVEQADRPDKPERGAKTYLRVTEKAPWASNTAGVKYA